MSSPSDLQIRKATLCVFLASICFSTGGLFIKMIPWGALAINGARNLIGACVIGIFLLATHHRVVINRTVIIGALSLVGVTTLYALANKMTTAANTIVLQYTAPVFVILFMALIFHSRPSKTDVLTCTAVLFGVCLFFIDGLQSGGTFGNILALLSGVCYAGVFMMNAGKNADALSSSFLGQLAAGICFTPFCAAESDFSVKTLLMVFALGAIQVGLAYILLSAGIRYTPPVTASLITGLEPVLNPIWVAAFYHETISGLAFIGAFIVIGTIILYNLHRANST
ncbi:MAG: EamA family transporter [Lachnospiraceae bacterium]|nr:EamA family transporter [Lachnospiraceae bacterium]